MTADNSKIAVLDVSIYPASYQQFHKLYNKRSRKSLTDHEQTTLVDRLPASSKTLFEAKATKALTFEAIATELGRSEVAVAALFYGQAQASPEDVAKLAKILSVSEETLGKQLLGFPDR